MKQGLLWYDDSNKPLPQKVALAVARFRQKFGTMPDLCYVHPSALDNGSVKVGAVSVEALPTVLKHHLFVGVRDERST